MLPLTVRYTHEKALAFLVFFFFFIRDVKRFLHRLPCTALCSFSSTAHLVGYYAKEMESIAEKWVMLFTGKSDYQRQGITPSRSDVSWKIPLFHWEEGKVHKIGNGWQDHRNFVWKRRRNIWAKIFSKPRTQKCQECKTRIYCPS